MRPVTNLMKINLRVDATQSRVIDAVAAVLGFELPTTSNSSSNRGSSSCLWLGPDEWLIVKTGSHPDDLAQRLASAVSLGWGSVVDVSDHYAVLELSGPEAPQVISHGCSLDTHARRWPLGACAQTLLAHMQVILHHVAPGPTFHVYVRRSLADYVVTWLLDASVEYRGLAMDALSQASA